MIKYLLIVSIFTGLFVSCNQQNNYLKGKADIIPQVNNLSVDKNANYILKSNIIISVESENQKELAKSITNIFKLNRYFNVDVVVNSHNGDIRLVTNKLLNHEAYHLVTNYTGITIEASSNAGFFYGIQSLCQMFPYGLDAIEEIKGIELPHVEITDEPRFKWRGMMLDVARHFYTVDEVKRVIDVLSFLKINTFHWHLVDDQGWRIEIKQYPKLTEIGAWRVNQEDVHWNERKENSLNDTANFGGFYTQEDIKEVVEYAATKYITVVPEIEGVAHVMSAIASYPHLSCKGERIMVPSGGVWPITEIFCPGKETTFEFLENVLDEVIELFPSKYVHIGGDEATKTNWMTCKHCQQRIKTENLHNEEELQSYMIKRISKYLKANDRIMIGWDEILEGGLAENAVVMSWRGMKGGLEAASLKHNVIMSPDTYVYLDHYQGDKKFEALAIGGYSPLKHVYNFDPIPNNMPNEDQQFVLGGQANVWTEYMCDENHLQYMIFPRMLAVSEVLWTKKENKDWDNFSNRVRRMFSYFDSKGINYSKSSYNLRSNKLINPKTKQLELTIFNEFTDTEIRYTLDGTKPDQNSKVFNNPIVIEENTHVEAQVFDNNQKVGRAFTEDIVLIENKAKGLRVDYNVKYSERYSTGKDYGLVDGIIGSTEFDDRKWQGWFNQEVELTIDFSKVKDVQSVSVGLLADRGNQILIPQLISVMISQDGENYLEEKQFNNPETLSKEKIRSEIIAVFNSKARFVKIKLSNASNERTGEKGWTFIDEVILK